MTRTEKLKIVWRAVHRDYKSRINGVKAVMVLREGTCLVDLENLTDEEINRRLPREFRDI